MVLLSFLHWSLIRVSTAENGEKGCRPGYALPPRFSSCHGQQSSELRSSEGSGTCKLPPKERWPVSKGYMILYAAKTILPAQDKCLGRDNAISYLLFRIFMFGSCPPFSLPLLSLPYAHGC